MGEDASRITTIDDQEQYLRLVETVLLADYPEGRDIPRGRLSRLVQELISPVTTPPRQILAAWLEETLDEN